jgi:hypothetical protein
MLYVQNRNGEKIRVKINHIGSLGRVEVVDCLGKIRPRKKGKAQVYWLIKCECGEFSEVPTRKLSLCKNGCPRCRCGNKSNLCANAKDRLVRRMYRKYKDRDRLRGGELSIPLEDFARLVSERCFYCNGIDTRAISKEKVRLNGLDRVDSSRGYSLDNVVPCCTKCNTMKWSLTRGAFISHIKKISSFLSKKGI